MRIDKKATEKVMDASIEWSDNSEILVLRHEGSRVCSNQKHEEKHGEKQGSEEGRVERLIDIHFVNHDCFILSLLGETIWFV